MSKKLRISQHKPPREEAKAKELADTKKENHHLRRKLKRLEKVVRRHAAVDPIHEEEMPDLVESREKIVEKCKKCYEGIIRVLNLAGRKYAVCPECKDRRRIDG